MVVQVYNLLGLVFNIYLGIGQARVFLAVARGQRGDLTQLFLGYDCLLAVVITSLIAGIAMGVGLLLLIVPGILLALLFWSYYWLIIDGKCKMFDAFGQALEIGKLNMGSMFILGLVSGALSVAGACMCYVGLLLTIPIASMMFTVAYLKMSGQSVTLQTK